jgi:hypothetical protein
MLLEKLPALAMHFRKPCTLSYQAAQRLPRSLLTGCVSAHAIHIAVCAALCSKVLKHNLVTQGPIWLECEAQDLVADRDTSFVEGLTHIQVPVETLGSYTAV